MACQKGYQVPAKLLQPMWLRSRESLTDDGLIYDPIATAACQKCQLAPECLSENVDQQQLLHATLTFECDEHVKSFLKKHPNGWVINVGAGLDTRFYRLDNGRCHWLELDINEHLLWRQRLFHANERYHMRCGSVTDTQWLDSIPVPDNVPLLMVCEHALLECSERQVAHFIQMLGRHFKHAQACFVVAGDKCSSSLASKLGSGRYRHGISEPAQKFSGWLPWLQTVFVTSPIDRQCNRWNRWQRWLAKLPFLKHRLTPIFVHISW